MALTRRPLHARGARSAADGGFDYYWLSRDSALLIRGGANYAYEQINAELQSFAVKEFGLKPEVRRKFMRDNAIRVYGLEDLS